MNARYCAVIFLTIIILLACGFPHMSSAVAKRDQASIVASEISAFANLLSVRPESAIDLSEVSGAYCFNVDLEDGGKMTHYAINPASTREDVVDFINAEPFIKAGIKLKKLPRFPGKLGSMKPNQWYFLPAGEYEPHHGVRFSFPLIMRAVSID